MRYFEATQEGQHRTEEARKLLEKFTGSANAAIFLKERTEGFEPVGLENLYAVVQTNPSTMMIALVDSEGNAKATSTYMGKIRGEDVIKQIEEAGIKRYDGRLNLPI